MDSKWLAGHKYAKRPKGDPLNADKVASMLPGGETLYNEVKRAEEFFDDTKRIGAGGVKAGSVGLRFIDRKENAAMHERFTETGKTKKKKEKNQDLRLLLNKDAPAPRGIPMRICSLPSNYCPDCDSACPGGFQPYEHMDHRTRKTTEFQTMLNFSPLIEGMPNIGLRPGDVIRHIICARCVCKVKTTPKLVIDIAVDTPWGPDVVSGSVLAEFQRLQRISQNVERFLQVAWTLQKENTFIDEDGRDRVKTR